jgi:hypothetical protein
MVGARIEKFYKGPALERMQAGGGDHKSNKAKSGKANLPYPIDAGQSRDKVAEVVNVSGRSIQ